MNQHKKFTVTTERVVPLMAEAVLRDLDKELENACAQSGLELAVNLDQAFNGQGPFYAYFIMDAHSEHSHKAMHTAFLKASDLPAFDKPTSEELRMPVVLAEKNGYALVRLLNDYQPCHTQTPEQTDVELSSLYGIHYQLITAEELESRVAHKLIARADSV